ASVTSGSDCQSTGAAASRFESAESTAMKIQSLALLEQRRVAVIADLKLKTEAEDWHGVADAAMDLREIDAMAETLRYATRADSIQLRVVKQYDVAVP